jgi:hypothetical protein
MPALGYVIVLTGMVVTASWFGMGKDNRAKFFKEGIKF